jgi:outer membrane cobalamin receptor
MVHKPKSTTIKLCLFTVFILLCCSSVIRAATTGKIAGSIVDQNNDRLPGANVVVQGTSLGGATDIEGNYFILNIPPGVYNVVVSMIGYKRVTIEQVRVVIDQTTQINVSLEEAPIEGEEVTIVSERPAVEIDLTASKERVSSAQIANSAVTEVKEVLVQQSGVNINGGVRGGFGLDVTYVVDGQEIKDSGTNSTAYVSVNTTSIQELELLTGGWNAEYPQANSGIVNVVSKTARDKIHGNFKYRYRPAGKYHWGRNIYSHENFEWWEEFPDGSPGMNSLEFWQNNTGGGQPFTNMTAEERLETWQKFISTGEVIGLARDGSGALASTGPGNYFDYADRPDWDIEGTLVGPITSKIGFLVSGRYDRGTPIYPSSFNQWDNYNVSGKLNFDLTGNTKVILSGMYWKNNDGGAEQTIYLLAGNPKGWFYTPYDNAKFWPYSGLGFGGGENLGRLRPPEVFKQYSLQGKVSHVFNPNSYLEAAVQHYDYDYVSDWSLVENKGYHFFKENTGPIIPGEVYMNNGFFRNVGTQSDWILSDAISRNTSFKADFVSQIHRAHQIKTGAQFSTLVMDRHNVWARRNHRQAVSFIDGEEIVPSRFKPWEASLYTQDKMEFQGMIVNAGLRLDMFNVNRTVNYTITDPYTISDQTLGQEGEVGYVDFDPNSRYAVDTKTRVAISPRVGISHPITDNTVLHFMYGHFNQRPGWLMIGQLPGFTQPGFGDPPLAERELTRDEIINGAIEKQGRYDHQLWRAGNPALDFERVIQYEVGFEQNIKDVVSLDVTLFYKDAKNLTQLGINNGRAVDNFEFEGGSGLITTLWPDPTEYISENLGHTGRFSVPINGGYYNSRGLEFSLESRFSRLTSLRLIYNMLFSSSGSYGLRNYYRDFENIEKQNLDTFYGGNNGDQGAAGRDNDRWNPRRTLKLVANFNTPSTMGAFLGDWNLNVFSEYASGRKFTWHDELAGDFSSEPNNRTWKGYYNTNVRLFKRIGVMSGTTVGLSMDVINLFNQHQLRLPGYDYGTATDLNNYMREGKLPVTSYGEDNVWNWYNIRQTPRQVYFGIGLEF